METIEKLSTTTLQSQPLTHTRLKELAIMANSSEDHISRLAMGLSLSKGYVDPEWAPSLLNSELVNHTEVNPKHIRGRTLLKDETPIWMALTLTSQAPESYDEWRRVFKAHWERGVQILMERAISEENWIRTLRSCLTPEE
tara:strand:- start:174 stop:596 length:423 start_codon:yes stop_codon:yes gene_type:complete